MQNQACFGGHSTVLHGFVSTAEFERCSHAIQCTACWTETKAAAHRTITRGAVSMYEAG